MKIYNAKLRKNIDKTSGKHNFCQFFVLPNICNIYNIKSKLQNLFGELLLFEFSTDCYTKIEFVKISAISSSIGISRCASTE